MSSPGLRTLERSGNRYGTHSQAISVLPAHPAFICSATVLTEWTIPIPYLPLPSQPKLVLIYRPRRDRKLSWPWVAGWLHTEINVRRRELNPDTVAHLTTNRARRRLTSLIDANALTREISIPTVEALSTTEPPKYIWWPSTARLLSLVDW